MIIDESKYKTKKELFDYLVANKSELVALKKAAVKFTDSIFLPSEPALKTFNYKPDDDIKNGSIKRMIVGNTYGWMDSHKDVHIPGIFTKSIQENKAKILHLHDHEFKLTEKVGKFVDVFEQDISWQELGVNIPGNTIALIGYSNILKSYNEKIYSQYLNKEIDQHSVAMYYVSIHMAINDPDYKEEYANWTTYISKVANYKRAFDTGYFWAVTEAKLIEISAVIAGSNEITPTLEPKQITQVLEPDKSTQGKAINYKLLTNNFTLK